MDNTIEFILQCQKAVEIQKEWKLKSGDFFTRSLTDIVYTLDQVELDNINGLKPPIRKMSHRTWIGSKIWLPTQDQLQEMVCEENKIGNYLRNVNFCVYKISSFLEESGKKGELYFSMEQLWLAFVMSELYSKVWNGNDWIKEK